MRWELHRKFDRITRGMILNTAKAHVLWPPRVDAPQPSDPNPFPLMRMFGG
jgi:hypothetical protein